MSFDSENDDNDSGRRLRFLKSLQPEVSQFILENEVCEFIRFKFTLEMSGIAAIAIYQSQRRNLHMEDHLIELQRLKAGNPNIALFMLDACEAHAEEIFVYLNGLEEKYCLKDGLPLYNDTDCYPLYWLIKKNEAPRICAGSTRDSMRALRMHFGLSLKGSELPKCKYGTPSISEPGSSAHQRGTSSGTPLSRIERMWLTSFQMKLMQTRTCRSRPLYQTPFSLTRNSTMDW